MSNPQPNSNLISFIATQSHINFSSSSSSSWFSEWNWWCGLSNMKCLGEWRFYDFVYGSMWPVAVRHWIESKCSEFVAIRDEPPWNRNETLGWVLIKKKKSRNVDMPMTTDVTFNLTSWFSFHFWIENFSSFLLRVFLDVSLSGCWSIIYSIPFRSNDESSSIREQTNSLKFTSEWRNISAKKERKKGEKIGRSLLICQPTDN